MFIAAVIVGCSPSIPAAPHASNAVRTALSVTTRDVDERCARDAFVTFMTAVNKGNRSLLTSTLSGSFMWLTLESSTTYDRLDAVESLLRLSRVGQQWELRNIDVNGRGWHGGIDFGVVVRRTGGDVPPPHRDAVGKGVIEPCPDGRVRLFGLGIDLAPRGTELPR
jgi:hypothetical protein